MSGRPTLFTPLMDGQPQEHGMQPAQSPQETATASASPPQPQSVPVYQAQTDAYQKMGSEPVHPSLAQSTMSIYSTGFDEYIDGVPIQPYTDGLSAEVKRSKTTHGIKLAALLLMALVAVGILLIYLRFLLVPLALARIFVYMLQPMVNILTGKKKLYPSKRRCCLPRWCAICISLVMVLLILVAIGLVIYLSIVEVIEDSDRYSKQFAKLEKSLTEWAEDNGIPVGGANDNLPDASELALTVMDYLFAFFPEAILCLMFSLYMLLEYDDEEVKTKLRRTIDKKIMKYLILKFILSLVTAVLVTIILGLLQVDMFLLFGLLTFLLNFIPSIGSIIAVLLPIPIALLGGFALWHVALIIICPGIVQLVIGNFIEPKVMGDKMEMTAVAVLIALAFWGSVWGIVGAFLSVPLTVVIRLWLLGIDHPFTVFMAGLLAGDFNFFDDAIGGEEKEKDVEKAE
eukprot:TRINITY_DN1319_c0_g1_i2.p1 TRINITY_DN1319_c0_g1~~TRINITY_DN1319_c0_g1_i2.p1  ORF type:complete len:474 (-),score=100.91 TRINITY_DN1319_c0_g1_i2:57-1427(-)